eukprot:CAMPEP_0198604578 /NCGR_PEP_ID=MMETSP1462-20131121/153398_1 /TAXON_ID=1333877 /ORGANISM="Brandtodinium nutriculum, Strain RCC3387" /LENGTH=222 /DNA_ID=CAMNT_0044336369 /DNA_START=34 /DNA_END=699 /DNA_ORIENTATION=-
MILDDVLQGASMGACFGVALCFIVAKRESARRRSAVLSLPSYEVGRAQATVKDKRERRDGEEYTCYELDIEFESARGDGRTSRVSVTKCVSQWLFGHCERGGLLEVAYSFTDPKELVFMKQAQHEGVSMGPLYCLAGVVGVLAVAGAILICVLRARWFALGAFAFLTFCCAALALAGAGSGLAALEHRVSQAGCVTVSPLEHRQPIAVAVPAGVKAEAAGDE